MLAVTSLAAPAPDLKLEALLSWGTIADGWRTGQAEPLFPRTELPEEGGSLDEAPADDPMRNASSPGVAT